MNEDIFFLIFDFGFYFIFLIKLLEKDDHFFFMGIDGIFIFFECRKRIDWIYVLEVIFQYWHRSYNNQWSRATWTSSLWCKIYLFNSLLILSMCVYIEHLCSPQVYNKINTLWIECVYYIGILFHFWIILWNIYN